MVATRTRSAIRSKFGCAATANLAAPEERLSQNPAHPQNGRDDFHVVPLLSSQSKFGKGLKRIILGRRGSHPYQAWGFETVSGRAHSGTRALSWWRCQGPVAQTPECGRPRPQQRGMFCFDRIPWCSEPVRSLFFLSSHLGNTPPRYAHAFGVKMKLLSRETGSDSLRPCGERRLHGFWQGWR